MLTLGGVAYMVVVVIPARAGESVAAGCRRGIRWAATSFAIVELCYVAVDSAILMGSSSLKIGDLVGAPYFLAGACAAVAASAIVFCARYEGRRSGVCDGFLWRALVLSAVVSTSHSVSRLDHRVVLTALDCCASIGCGDVDRGDAVSADFAAAGRKIPERQNECCVAILRWPWWARERCCWLALGMGWLYLGISADKSLSGLYGTAYGMMMMSKVYLVLLVMAMGAGNFFLVRRIETAPVALLTRLRRFGEAEIGLGFMAVLAAASMTSQPPPVDLPNNRASLSEIVARFRPEIPRMSSPAFAALSPPPPLDEAVKETQFNGVNPPSDANAVAWSEYNHHWSGLIVLAAGVFALLSRLRNVRWARNWPLVFAGLAVLIVLRADPEVLAAGAAAFLGEYVCAGCAAASFVCAADPGVCGV